MAGLPPLDPSVAVRKVSKLLYANWFHDTVYCISVNDINRKLENVWKTRRLDVMLNNITEWSNKPRAYIIVTINQRRETDTLSLPGNRVHPPPAAPPPLAPHLTGADNVSRYLQYSAAAAARPAIEATVS